MPDFCDKIALGHASAPELYGTSLISGALPFGLANHEKTYLAVAAFDNPRGDACGHGNKGLVADPRNHN
jgi:hypothetical protein